jgi:BirA family biotin operon repressor/biotin-[acetyl-CoA-carboxylase] ligase
MTIHFSPFLNSKQIRQHLSATRINTLSIFPLLNSSNEWALKYARCGDVCLAEQQTAGRGRRGHTWHSPPNCNLYLSLKWCFSLEVQSIGLLGLVIAVAIAECLEMVGITGHTIKWPNDILFENKKLAGILLESKGSSNEIVIGVGLNVNMDKQNIDNQKFTSSWCSLQQISGNVWDRNLLTAQLLNHLVTSLEKFNTLSFSQFMNVWKKWDHLYNQLVTVHSTKKYTAKVVGINHDGALLIEQEAGIQKSVYSADVSIRY